MKLTKEEFIEKYSSKFDDNEDEKIAFLEDISDSIEVTETDTSEKDAEIERLKTDNEMLKKKYIDRFLGEVSEETKEIDEEKIDESEEKEVIDIKEI